MGRSKPIALSQQVALIQETHELLFHRWRMYWQRSLSGRRSDPVRELTDAQFHAVMVVRFEESLTLGQLAERLHVSPPSASVMVGRLVRRGVLVRQPDRRDHRRVLIRVSPAMDVYLNEARQSRRKFNEALARKLGRATLYNWFDVMRRVRQVFQAEDTRRGADSPHPRD